MACNVSNEMSEHSENIRKAALDIQTSVKQEITKVAKEAQDKGEINATLNIPDMVEFIENAGKGAMITMKEMQSAYPIDNVLNMIKMVLIK